MVSPGIRAVSQRKPVQETAGLQYLLRALKHRDREVGGARDYITEEILISSQ